MGAAPSPRPPSPLLKVLNAFRHQRWVQKAEQAQKDEAAQVLNAFRHQRWVQKDEQGATVDNPCAQRLSASEMGAALGYVGSSLANVSAQRLSASEMGADSLTGTDQVLLLCSTPFGIRDGCSAQIFHIPDPAAVLNAFRHQRWVQRPASIVYPSLFLCSTPFGIRDGCRRGYAAVFNQPLCSTPFGIRDGCRMPCL